jgi:hypothetical protein
LAFCSIIYLRSDDNDILPASIYSVFDLNVQVESITGARGSRGRAEQNILVFLVVCYS